MRRNRQGVASMTRPDAAPAPPDAPDRRAAPPIVCYPARIQPRADVALLTAARRTLTKVGEAIAPPRDACAFRVPI